MERFELSAELADEIRRRTMDAGFMKLVQSVRRGGTVTKTSLRPVEIGGERMLQAETTEGGRVRVRNIAAAAAEGALADFIASKGARDIHLVTASGDLHVRVTRKGHELVSRSAGTRREAVVRPHDRVKQTPLNSFDSSALLRALDIADGSGAIRASRRGKYDQVNEFLRLAGEAVVGEKAPDDDNRPFTIVDCGCGKAYLTLSLHQYLVHALKLRSVRVVGVDRRADVVAAARRVAEQLDIAAEAEFVEADLADVSLADISPAGAVDMVVSLHACDTATDEALAKGIEWGARHVLAAPCCQHELQHALGAGRGAGEFSAVLRQPILRERMCDILTDAFRAAIMRIAGFRTQVVEFVSSEATARNIMLRCERGVKPGQAAPVDEYLALREYWKVAPWLETRLGERFGKWLARYE